MKQVLILAVALAGCTASAESQRSQAAEADRDLAKATEGRVAGKPQDCIPINRAGGPQIIDKQTLVYTDMGTVYVNRLPAACPSLDRNDTIISEVYGGNLCRNDRFRSLQPGTSIPGAYCQLGSFTPYRKAKD